MQVIPVATTQVMDVEDVDVAAASRPPVEASVQSALEATIAEMRKELDALKSEKEKSEMEEGDGTDGYKEDATAALESPYSAVFGVLLDPSSSGWARVSAVSMITLLTFTQLFLCFAFWDTSSTLHGLGQHAQYAAPVPMGNYYEVREANGTPTITYWTAIAAVYLLALSVRNVIHRTSVMAAHPFEYVCFLAKAPSGFLGAVYQVFIVVFLYCIWFIRCT